MKIEHIVLVIIGILFVVSVSIVVSAIIAKKNSKPKSRVDSKKPDLKASGPFVPPKEDTSLDRLPAKTQAIVDSGNPVSPSKAPVKPKKPVEEKSSDPTPPPKGSRFAVITACGHSAMHWSRKGDLKCSKIVRVNRDTVTLRRGSDQFTRPLMAAGS